MRNIFCRFTGLSPSFVNVFYYLWAINYLLLWSSMFHENHFLPLLSSWNALTHHCCIWNCRQMWSSDTQLPLCVEKLSAQRRKKTHRNTIQTFNFFLCCICFTEKWTWKEVSGLKTIENQGGGFISKRLSFEIFKILSPITRNYVKKKSIINSSIFYHKDHNVKKTCIILIDIL